MCAFKWNCPFHKFYAWAKSFTKVKLNLYKKVAKFSLFFYLPYTFFSSYSRFNEWKFCKNWTPIQGNSIWHEGSNGISFFLLLLSVNWINFIPHTHNFFFLLIRTMYKEVSQLLRQKDENVNVVKTYLDKNLWTRFFYLSKLRTCVWVSFIDII